MASANSKRWKLPATSPASYSIAFWCLALLPLAAWLLVSLVTLPSLDFVTLVSWIAGTWTASLLTLFVLIACWHSRLGIQVVLEDYVHDQGLKTLTLVLSGFVHVVLAALGVFAILRIAFGSPL